MKTLAVIPKVIDFGITRAWMHSCGVFPYSPARACVGAIHESTLAVTSFRIRPGAKADLLRTISEDIIRSL